MTLIQKEKYDSLPQIDRTRIETLTNDKISIKDVKIKNPNNPAQLIDAKLLVFKV